MSPDLFLVLNLNEHMWLALYFYSTTLVYRAVCAEGLGIFFLEVGLKKIFFFNLRVISNILAGVAQLLKVSCG